MAPPHFISEDKMARYWLGSDPHDCNICGLNTMRKSFVDGKTHRGSWAIMCLPCHKDQGVGLGIGKGQQYEWDGKGYAKVAG